MNNSKEKILVTWIIKNMPSVIMSISLHDTEEEAREFIRANNNDPDLRPIIHNRVAILN
jgi:hypothetical protein